MIGMFDSGLGGLSVWRELVATLPEEPVLYLADQGYCPYGGRSEAEIIARSEKIADYLLSQGADLLLIACNTATSAAAAQLRASHPHTPIVAMEPAIKPAALASKTGKVGVLATEGTLRGSKFRQLSAQLADQASIISQPGRGFVELVESGDLHSPAAHDIISTALTPLLAADVDHIVLGCTHYPFLIELIRQQLPGHIDIIEPSQAVVRQTLRLLPAERAANVGRTQYRFASTSNDDSMQHFLQQVLHRSDAVEHLTL